MTYYKSGKFSFSLKSGKNSQSISEIFMNEGKLVLGRTKGPKVCGILRVIGKLSEKIKEKCKKIKIFQGKT